MVWAEGASVRRSGASQLSAAGGEARDVISDRDNSERVPSD